MHSTKLMYVYGIIMDIMCVVMTTSHIVHTHTYIGSSTDYLSTDGG